jgi:hypothetical protein
MVKLKKERLAELVNELRAGGDLDVIALKEGLNEGQRLRVRYAAFPERKQRGRFKKEEKQVVAELLAQGGTPEAAAAKIGRSRQGVLLYAQRKGLIVVRRRYGEGGREHDALLKQFVAWRSEAGGAESLEAQAARLGWTPAQWRREEQRALLSQPTFARMCAAVGAALVLKSDDGACVLVGEDAVELARALKARRVYLNRSLKEQGEREGVGNSVIAHRERNRNGVRGLALSVVLTWSRHLGFEPQLLPAQEAAQLETPRREPPPPRRVRGSRPDAVEMAHRLRVVTEESEREACGLVATLVSQAQAQGLSDVELARRVGWRGASLSSSAASARELTQVAWAKMCALAALKVVLADETGFELVVGEDAGALAEQLRARRLELGIEALELTQREGLGKTAQIKRERVPRKQGHTLPLLLRWAAGLGLKMELREQD